MKSVLVCIGLMLAAPLAQAHDHGGMIHLVFAGGAVHAHCSWVTGPQSPAESVLQIQWMDGAKHVPLEPPGAFAADLFMPEMGHGSAPTQTQRILDAAGNPLLGAYSISNMYFTMAGKWQVNVTLNYTNGTKETQTMDVDVPVGGGHHHSLHL